MPNNDLIGPVLETIIYCLKHCSNEPVADGINIKLPFSAFNFNKTQFITELAQKFNLDLPLHTLWEYPHIEEYAQYLVMRLSGNQHNQTAFIQHSNLQKQGAIAVIGLGCRFPGGAHNSEEFWNLMLSAKDPITEALNKRWDLSDLREFNLTKETPWFGGFLDDVDLFDAPFFNISPKEAARMDPQQRLFLEVSWHAIENAALTPEYLKHTSTGVFVGVSMHDYERLALKSVKENKINAYSNLGVASSAISARLSYFMGLNGPSFAIDTACSSSLSALYQACLSLRSGDCDLAIAGGVNLILEPGPTIGYSQAHMMAADGRCKTFDDKADGYVRSEGCGVVILKPLDSALSDGDQIFAVIKSTMANQDGDSNGLTAPNMLAQKQMLLDALFCASLQPDDIDFFETHGTGTYIGDPIEIDAINQVYATGSRNEPLYLGALKSQMGHCEAAAGIAGFMKSVLVLYHQQIPANLHFNHLNKAINLDKVPCVIPTQIPSLSGLSIRHAAVSSYGFTGTNTHAILEKAPEPKPRDTTIELPLEYLFVVSAKSHESLRHLIADYADYLALTEDSLADMCYTAAIGRSHFKWRLDLSVRSKEELIEQLSRGEQLIQEVTPSDELMQSHDLNELAQAYCQGKSIDWAFYYTPYQKALRKVSLPTYAFDRQHYWLETRKTKEQEHLPDDCFYEMLWQEQDLPEQERLYQGTIWLIDNGVLSTPPVLGKHIHLIPQTSAEIACTKDIPQDLLGIFYYAPSDATEEVMSYQKRYAHDFLNLIQTLAQKQEQLRGFDLGLVLVTQRAIQIESDELPIQTQAAPLGGMIKALQWEAPYLKARWLDVDDYDSIPPAVWTNPQSLFALRQNQGYSPIIAQAILGPSSDAFYHEGLHWITGGTGGLGIALTKYLVNQGVTHLLLSSRRGETQEVSEALGPLRAQGAVIEVLALDVTDKKAMKGLIKQKGQEFAAIYHLAGIEQSGPFTDITTVRLDEVFGAKIGGAALLDELTQSLALHHFVLFSSVASFAGNYHQLAYAAANQYLEALAQKRAARGLPVTCINWGPWAQVGMATQMQLKLDESTLLPLQAGLHALTYLIRSKSKVIAVTRPEAVVQRMAFVSEPKPQWLGAFLRLEREAQKSMRRSQLALDLQALEPKLRLHRLTELVNQSIMVVLGLHEPPAPDKGFFELGIDSLMSVEVGRRLQEQLGITLKPTAAFDYPNIDQLAGYLETALTEQQRLITYSRHELAADTPIAIIGMSCRFPGGANSLGQFWDNLYQGVDAIGAVPKQRFDINSYYDADTENTQKAHTREFGFIDDIDAFDAEFFGISPREAILMDPQQRILLETAWHALEDAGIEPATLKGKRVGVFVGIQSREYADFLISQTHENFGAYQSTGSSLSVSSGRIAYVLGTQGPTMSIDTACSSSLVALHEAVRAIRAGDCELAIVAGVNSIIDPNVLVSLSNAQMLSVDGRCKTFDAGANGYGRAEGCGVIILQGKAQAMAQGARIWANVRASQVNQDGASSGLTVPNGVAQTQLLQECLIEAGLAPEDIDYIECHGTGTSLGDPIEIGAIAEVYAGRSHPLVVGTVKTNIGHLESAAGIAGVIKTVLAMAHQYIPKHLHFHQLNPHINLDVIPAQIPVEGLAWEQHDQQPRRAGVSSFGFSGTNAHVILEEAPQEYVPKRQALPLMEFKRERYWLSAAPRFLRPQGFNEQAHPFLQTEIPLIPAQEDTYYFENVINAHYPEFIPDHKIYDYPVIAGAVYLSTALQLAKEYLHWSCCRLREVEFIEVLALPKDNLITRVYVHVRPASESEAYHVAFYSKVGAQKELVLHARLLLEKADSLPSTVTREAIAAELPTHSDYTNQNHLEQANALSLALGPHFNWCDDALTNQEHTKTLIRFRLPALAEQEPYAVYPGLIDSCFQGLLALSKEQRNILAIPFGIDSMTWDVTRPLPTQAYIHLLEQNTFNYTLFGADDAPVAVIERFRAREIPQEALEKIINKQVHEPEFFYRETWEPLLLELSSASVATYQLLGAVPERCELLHDEQSTHALFFVPEEQALPQVLAEIQRLLGEAESSSRSVVFVTERLAWIPESNNPISLVSGGVLGLIKTALLEVPHLSCRLLDVGGIDDLVYGLSVLEQSDSSLLAVRQQQAYHLMLRHQSQRDKQEGRLTLCEGDWQVRIKARGDFSGLELIPYAPPNALKDYEVALHVHAVGLNDKDVLNVLGLYPGDAGEVGGDCSGVVTRVGKKVRHLSVGDAVFGIAQGAFKSEALSHELLLTHKPDSLSYAQAAALPVVMMSAYYGLYDLAQLKPGERVLIHTAAGGVGLCAIALAKRLGCRIFATCSTLKRDYLISLGMEHLYDSRSTDFAAAILRDTEGKGVDVVLNTLTGEGFIEASLSALSANGRFIELSKRNIYTAERMHEVRPDVAYHTIAIDLMCTEEPQAISRLLGELVALHEARQLPALPLSTYPIERLPEAMRTMQQGTTIGKLIIELPEPVDEVLQESGCYVITGGLGGLGLALCEWLSAHKASHIILLARRPADEATTQRLNQLAATVAVHQLELTQYQELKKTLKAINKKHPIRGIFHLAGVLDDGIVTEQTPERLQKVWAPKAEVAQTLHRLTCELGLNEQLNYFVLFSSIASSIGSPGQANYAAANSYLDTLAISRWQEHLPALSINWGSWAEAGMAAHLIQGHGSKGIGAFSLARGLSLMAQALMQDRPVVQVADINWARISQQGFNASWLRAVTGVQQEGQLTLLLQNTPQEQRITTLQLHLERLLQETLNLPPATRINPEHGFFDLGMDSLMAVELKNKIRQFMGGKIKFSNTLIFDYPSINALVNYISEQLRPKPIDVPVIPPAKKIRTIFLGDKDKNSTDNQLNAAKFWTMFLVVWYHFLRPTNVYPFIDKVSLFNDINQFSGFFAMPVFILISGIYAKNSLSADYCKNLFIKILLPYFILNLFGFFLSPYQDKTFLIDPNLESWFLLAFVMWSIVTPFLAEIRGIIYISVIVALLIGLTDKIGTVLSLGRFFYYLPFFLFGFLYGKRLFNYTFKYQKIVSLIMIATGLGLSLFFVSPYVHDYNFYYGIYSYKTLNFTNGTGIILRLVSLLTIFIGSIGFIWLIPRTNSIFCAWGVNSLYVYLGHLFFMIPFIHFGLYSKTQPWYAEVLMIVFIFLLTVSLSTEFGSRIVRWVFQPNIERFIFKSKKN